MVTSGQPIAPAVLPPGKKPGTQWGGGAGLIADLDDSDKEKYISPAGIRIDDRPGRSLVSIQTTLSWLHHFILLAQYMCF
jgi:hypothetical protein